MREKILRNSPLIGIIVIGAWLIAFGTALPEQLDWGFLGAAFAATGFVGIYMMLTTSDVSKSLHERFDKLNLVIQNSFAAQTKVIQDTAAAQTKVIQDTAVAQTKVLAEIVTSQAKMSGTLEKMNATLERIDSTLGRVEHKMEPKA